MKNFSSYKKTPFLGEKTIKDHLGLLEKYEENVTKLLKESKRLNKDSVNLNDSEYRDSVVSIRHNYNAQVLHRLYFSTIAKEATKVPKSFHRLIEDFNKKSYNFKDYNSWKEDFIACAKASRGWVLFGFSPFENVLVNQVVDNHDVGLSPGFCPILVLDVWEHAYIGDYGTNREKYVTEWFKYINWDEVENQIARWIPLFKSKDFLTRVTAGLQKQMLTLGLAKES